MKQCVILMLLGVAPLLLFTQIGLKGGINFATISKNSSINSSSRFGFHVGVLFSSSSKRIINSRTELIFSQQGYNYKTAANTGNVNLNYILLPQYMSINITKYFFIQLGGQMAYLLNAKADSSAGNGNGSPYGNILNYYNKFDFGYGGGVEIHPWKALLIGARVNISLGNLYKDIDGTSPNAAPSFIPKVAIKSNLFQVFAGWQFTNPRSKKKEE
jgi:hypothetical protein